MSSEVGPGRPFRVQLAMDARLEYFREATLGARRYGFETGRLVVVDRWLPHDFADPAAAAARDGVSGLIVTAHSATDEARWARIGLPVVNVSNGARAPVLPVVTQDDVGAGRLAAEHLLACGCRHFGFWGQWKSSYGDQRWAGFSARLAGRCARGGARAVNAAADYPRMKAWLAAIPSPCGVFACLDEQALSIMRAARDLGRRVPEDVAVLGAGDDNFLVEFESVPLSSVRLPARRIGYEAAALLERMIAEGRRSADSIYLPVTEVSERKSTDVRFARDELVARVLSLMRERPELSVKQVVAASAAGRTTIRERFLAETGRGMLEELQRVRLERAKVLLATTDHKLAVIAERSGVGEQQKLCRLFRRVTGMTPGEFRTGQRGPLDQSGSLSPPG